MKCGSKIAGQFEYLWTSKRIKYPSQYVSVDDRKFVSVDDRKFVYAKNGNKKMIFVGKKDFKIKPGHKLIITTSNGSQLIPKLDKNGKELCFIGLN